MKYKKNLCVLALLLVLPAATVWADTGRDHRDVDYITDYYMIVESRDGGVNVYSYPDEESGQLNNRIIPNGTAFHIEGELTDENGKEWGYTQYDGVEAYVLTDDLRPAGAVEAAESEFQLNGGKRTNYEVTIQSEDGEVVLYLGPGEKFGEAEGDNVASNGETYTISKQVEMDDGVWGKASNEERQGWLLLEDTDLGQTVQMEEATPTATPAPTVTAEATPTATPKVDLTATPAPSATPKPTAAAEATPTEAPTTTPTPAVTPKLTAAAEAAPTKAPTATPTPSVTPEPTPAATASPEATPTEKPEETPAEASEEESEQASAETVSQPESNRVWLVILAGIVLVAAGIAVIWKRKKK